VENIIEELDWASEWFLMEGRPAGAGEGSASKLYFKPNTTTDAANGTAGAAASMQGVAMEVPVLATLVSINGSMEAPVKGVRFSGIKFTHSLATFLEPYEVPSGGKGNVEAHAYAHSHIMTNSTSHHASITACIHNSLHP
jgi:hypothetical protein